MKRHATDYPGVFYREVKRVGAKGIDKVYYVLFKRDGKTIEAKAGSQFRNDMTPARANNYRSALIDGKELTPAEHRAAEKAAKEAKEAKWAIDRIFKEYMKSRPENSARKIDQGRYEKYLKTPFGAKAPLEIAPLDVDRLRIKLSKKLSPQSVKHILNLLTWVINYGVDKRLCQGIDFKIKKPTVSNEKTEDLTPEQLERLLKAIDADKCIQAGAIMKMALYTGMRRGEMFKLTWDDIDFQRGFILIRDPKGKKDQRIPMNDATRELLKKHPQVEKSPYVFPGRKGKRRTDIKHQVNRIKEAAGLPANFRALHGLRHVFASMLASSGQVDMYILQKLLTHKSPTMTQRYSHLRDETLKKASALAGDIIGQIVNGNDSQKVVKIEDQS